MNTKNGMSLGARIFLILFAVGFFVYVEAFPATVDGTIARDMFFLRLCSSPVFWFALVVLFIMTAFPPREH